MSRAAELTHQIISAMSEQSNTLFSKALLYVGVSGSSAGIVTGVVNSADKVANIGGSWSDHVGIACGIGGFTCLAIKTATTVYFERKKNEREQAKEKREQELHEQKLREGNE